MEQKPWFKSLTIIGAAIAGLATALPDIVNTVQVALPMFHISTNPFVVKVVAICGVIVAIYGRLTAKTTLK